MSRPPIKAMEAVKRYCEKKKTCDGCPLHTLNEYGYISCNFSPAGWEIKKEGSEMSREKALEVMNLLRFGTYGEIINTHECINDALDAAIEALKEQRPHGE